MCMQQSGIKNSSPLPPPSSLPISFNWRELNTPQTAQHQIATPGSQNRECECAGGRGRADVAFEHEPLLLRLLRRAALPPPAKNHTWMSASSKMQKRE